MATASTPDNADDYAAPPRGPIAAVRVCFVKYFAFSGRASRSEYWWFFLFFELVVVGAYVGECYVLGNCDLSDSIFIRLWYLATLLPYYAVGARRLHDIGRSGWWMLLLVPQDLWGLMLESHELYDLVFALSLIIWLPLIVMLCFRSKTNPAT